MKWTDKDAEKALKQGWLIINCIGSVNGDFQLQKDDKNTIFEKDCDAWRFVRNGNDQIHIKAKKLLKLKNFQEYDRIMNIREL